jgi:hypothetical protein
LKGGINQSVPIFQQFKDKAKAAHQSALSVSNSTKNHRESFGGGNSGSKFGTRMTIAQPKNARKLLNSSSVNEQDNPFSLANDVSEPGSTSKKEELNQSSATLPLKKYGHERVQTSFQLKRSETIKSEGKITSMKSAR